MPVVICNYLLFPCVRCVLYSDDPLHCLHMIIVFQRKRVNRGVNAERLAHRDGMVRPTVARFVCRSGLVHLGQVLLNVIIIEIVVVVVPNVLITILLGHLLTIVAKSVCASFRSCSATKSVSIVPEALLASTQIEPCLLLCVKLVEQIVSLRQVLLGLIDWTRFQIRLRFRKVVNREWLDVHGAGAAGCWRSNCLLSAEETVQHLHEDGLLSVETTLTEACLLREGFPIDITTQICLRLVNGERVVKAVKFEELTNQLGHQRRISGRAQLLCTRILPMEATPLLLDLVLIVDHLEDTGAQLCPHLSQDAIRLQTLYDQVL